MSKAGKPEVRLPVCYGCPSRYHYDESIPLKAKGVMMHCGDVFCVEGKKARKFSRSDPKSRAPDWCPKRKTPCELRVYCFKNTDEWMMHEYLCTSMGKEISPEGRRYAVEYELHTNLSPHDFAKVCNQLTDAELVGAAVHRHHVVEVDDGLHPQFFYKTEKGYILAPFFNAETARKNVKEDTV